MLWGVPPALAGIIIGGHDSPLLRAVSKRGNIERNAVSASLNFAWSRKFTIIGGPRSLSRTVRRGNVLTESILIRVWAYAQSQANPKFFTGSLSSSQVCHKVTGRCSPPRWGRELGVAPSLSHRSPQQGAVAASAELKKPGFGVWGLGFRVRAFRV